MFAKAADVKAAFGDGTANTDSLFFTLTGATANAAIPVGWEGQFVRIRPIGADMWFFFSSSNAATAVIGVSAADGGAAATRGEFVPNGELFQCEVPYAREGAGVFFVRIGSGAGTGVVMTKASGMPGNNLE